MLFGGSLSWRFLHCTGGAAKECASCRRSCETPDQSSHLGTGCELVGRQESAPLYPSDARSKHIRGQIFLKVSISTEGDVQDVVVTSGEPALAPAAAEAVRQWKFKPYLLNGDPAEVETQIHINFVLSP